MARRANKKVNPLMAVMTILVFVFIFLGAYFIYFKVSDPFRGVRSLNIGEYMDNSRSLAGNTLLIRCRMSEKIRWEPEVGGLWVVDVKNDGGVKKGVLAVFIPSVFDSNNIQVGQELKIQVKIDRNGVLVAEKVLKI